MGSPTGNLPTGVTEEKETESVQHHRLPQTTESEQGNAVPVADQAEGERRGKDEEPEQSASLGNYIVCGMSLQGLFLCLSSAESPFIHKRKRPCYPRISASMLDWFGFGKFLAWEKKDWNLTL